LEQLSVVPFTQPNERGFRELLSSFPNQFVLSCRVRIAKQSAGSSGLEPTGAVAIANVPLQGSQATFTTSALGIGGHSISAFFPGVFANPNGSYPGAAVSQSPTLVLGVDP
jgi:hypothetical protein